MAKCKAFTVSAVKGLSKRLKQSALMVGSRIKSGREFQTAGPATEKAGQRCRRHSAKPVTIATVACRLAKNRSSGL